MAAMHASSFLANYEGHPFMQPISSNKALVYSLSFFVLVIFATASEAVPELNDALSLVLSPSAEFRKQIILLIVADIALSVGLSRAIGAVAVSVRGRSAEKRAKAL